MIALDKYSVIEGGSSDAYKYHRNLLEQVLRENTLSEPARAELKHQLQLTIDGEIAATHREEDEEARKKKEGSGDGSGQSEGGAGAASGGAGLVSRDSGVAYEENSEEAEPVIDPLVLLLLLAENDIAARHETDPVPAAVVLDEDKIAHLYKTEAEQGNQAQLQELERHAARVGAQAFQLKVAPDAVDLFKQKFGYEPIGAQFNRAGKPMQRMRKVFNRAALATPQPPQ